MNKQASLDKLNHIQNVINKVDFYVSQVYDAFSYTYEDVCAIQLRTMLIAYFLHKEGLHISMDLFQPARVCIPFETTRTDQLSDEYFEYISDVMTSLFEDLGCVLGKIADYDMFISYQYDSPMKMYENIDDPELMEAVDLFCTKNNRTKELLDDTDNMIVVVQCPRLGRFINNHDDETNAYLYDLLGRDFIFQDYWTCIFEEGNLFKNSKSLPSNANAFYLTNKALYYMVMPSAMDYCDTSSINISNNTFFLCLEMERYMNEVEAAEGGIDESNEIG